MHNQMISKANWNGFFASLSKRARGHQILLELIGTEIGDQIEDEWKLFEGLSYDRESDIIHLHTRFVEHAISAPRSIMAQEHGSLRSLCIQNEAGFLQIVHFRNPPLIKGVIETQK
jgi:hypothetical protein